MKKEFIVYIIISINIPCSFSQLVWDVPTALPGPARGALCGFVINDSVYMGTGFKLNPNTYYNDFYIYSPLNNSWVTIADLPLPKRYAGSAFVSGGYGYAGFGWSQNLTPQKDIYRYNPAMNTWTPTSNFPASPRYTAITFSLGSDAYIGTGYTPLMNDIWKYNSTSNTWTQVASYPLSIQSAVAFSFNGMGYVTTGSGGSGTVPNTFMYIPTLNSWVSKASFPGSPRYGAFAFKICNKIYVGSGSINNGNTVSDVFSYDPILDSWQSSSSLPGSGVRHAFGFDVDNVGYVACGLTNNGMNSTNSVYRFSLVQQHILTSNILCDGTASFSIKNFHSYLDYIWDFGDGTTYSGISPTHTYNQAGTYTVTLHYSYECISKQTDTTIIVPTASTLDSQFSAMIDSCSNTITLNPSVTSHNHIWLFGNGSSSNQTNPSFTYLQPGNYSITHIIFDSCIADTTITQITINESGIQNYFIPNSFSPNYDGLNDYFNVISRNKCDEIEIKIYNRWGNYLLSINQNFAPGWDGRINGTECPAGVYVYEVKINHQIKRGFVHLYR